MQINLFPIRLLKAELITPNVKHFVFQADQTPPFNYIAGQFITIHFEKEGKAFKRSYSIANDPKQNNRIEFAAGYIENGPGSELLFNLKEGETLCISGPFGRLILKEDIAPKRYILVATSTGITPYRAMLEALKTRLKADPALKIIILQGVQTQEDVLYAQEFLDFTSSYRGQVEFRVHLSRQSQGLQTHEHLGYVQHAFPGLNLNPAEDLVYLCGNPSMIDESFEDLKTRGFPIQHIIREKYISTKSGV